MKQYRNRKEQEISAMVGRYVLKSIVVFFLVIVAIAVLVGSIIFIGAISYRLAPLLLLVGLVFGGLYYASRVGREDQEYLLEDEEDPDLPTYEEYQAFKRFQAQAKKQQEE